MAIFMQAAVTGLFIGGVYGLIAMGLSLVFGVMRVINFAHGEFVLIGMYATYFSYNEFGLNPFLSLILVIPGALILGAVLHKVLMRRIVSASEVRQLLLTFGLGLLIHGTAQIVFSPNQHSLQGFDWGSELLRMGPIIVRPTQVVGFAIAVAVTVSLTLFLAKTDLGRSMRATVDDAEMAESSGVRSDRIYMVTMALGLAIACVAGTVLMTYYPVSPSVGTQFLVLAFVALVLGGLGNVTGAFVGGIVAGIVQQFTATYIDVGLQDVGLFALFIVVLAFRPEGLLGRRVAV